MRGSSGGTGQRWTRPNWCSPKSMKRTCSCGGRLTPRDRRLDAWICWSRARLTSGALKVVAGEEEILSIVEPHAAPPPPGRTGWPAHWGQSARPQWPGLNCRAPNPAGGHSRSPSSHLSSGRGPPAVDEEWVRDLGLPPAFSGFVLGGRQLGGCCPPHMPHSPHSRCSWPSPQTALTWGRPSRVCRTAPDPRPPRAPAHPGMPWWLWGRGE